MSRFTLKQNRILNEYISEKPKILVLYGAVRSGKTFIAVFLFLLLVKANANMNFMFIIGGVTQKTIELNILSTIEAMLGVTIKLDKLNSFRLWGNRIICYNGSDSSSWKSVRGFTAKGAILNEGTALNNRFVKEVIARCSESDSRIFIDTNPDNPNHPVNTDYIKKSGQKLSTGRINIQAYHFDIFDNDFLDQEYVESLIASTPSGMFTDRDIYGRWVAAEGAVYPDFSDENFYDQKADAFTPVRYFAGVDWGYEHPGVMTVFCVDDEGCRRRIEEHKYQHRDIEFWRGVALDITSRYGRIPFYCDHNPAYREDLVKNGLNVWNAEKDIMAGIGYVASLIKKRKFLVNKYNCEGFKNEIYEYHWKAGKDQPVDINDDCMDADRYAVYTDYVFNEIEKERQRKRRQTMEAIRDWG